MVLTLGVLEEWFERFDGAYSALWWVAAGHIPSIEEAVERLRHLRARGDSPRAFTFARLYPPPGAVDSAPSPGFADACPAV